MKAAVIGPSFSRLVGLFECPLRLELRSMRHGLLSPLLATSRSGWMRLKLIHAFTSPTRIFNGVKNAAEIRIANIRVVGRKNSQKKVERIANQNLSGGLATRTTGFQGFTYEMSKIVIYRNVQCLRVILHDLLTLAGTHQYGFCIGHFRCRRSVSSIRSLCSEETALSSGSSLR